MKESYTIEEITEMLDLKNTETVRRYIRNGKNKDFDQICSNNVSPEEQYPEDLLMLELVNPQKRPYTVTRRSLELLIKRKFNCNDDEEITNLLTNFENSLKEDQPKRKKKHHLFGIKALPYSYNKLKKTVDKIIGKSPKHTSIQVKQSDDIIKKGDSISTEISEPKESAEYYKKVATILNDISKLIAEHDEELDMLNVNISQLEEELAICKQHQNDLKESKNSLIEKRKKVANYLL